MLKLFGAPGQPEAFKGDEDSSVIYNCQFRFTSASPKVCRTESISDSNSDSSEEESGDMLLPILDPHTETYTHIEEEEDE